MVGPAALFAPERQPCRAAGQSALRALGECAPVRCVHACVRSPAAAVHKIQAPVLLVAGSADKITPLSRIEQAKEILGDR